MDFFEIVKSRTSIRTFKRDEVPAETIKKIVDTACLAPSWGNKQCWRFVIVSSHVEKNIIGKASGQANISKACEDAPYVIVLCSIFKDSGIKNGMEYFLFDSGLAMENLILAAKAEGLDTCIVGWFDEKAIKGVLNIPEGIKIVAFTPIGYGNESVTPRPRKKQSEIVFHNFWGKGF